MGVKTWEMFVPGWVDWQAEWQAERGRVDLAAVATRLMGPAPGRRGERGRRLWWNCPFHEDENPSFRVDPGGEWWRCYGCGAKGDAATLVMKLEGLSFSKAVEALIGGVDFPRTAKPRPTPKPAPVVRPEPMTPEVLDLVEAAERQMWSPEGADALSYLRGRGLTETTIRSARLGATGRGILIPWFAGPDLVMVKVRRPDGADPRYEALRGSHQAGLYPGSHVIAPGLPAVVVEGEMDALILGQELSGLATVVTLGPASAIPTEAVREAMLPASPWYVATDDDPAGDQAAARWPSSSRRVRPPGSFKDWGEAREGGVSLRRWWTDRLAGLQSPPLFTWEELVAWRWGPAALDPTPGLVMDHPDTLNPTGETSHGA